MSKWLALYLEILRSFSYSADNQLRTSGRKSEGLNNALKILTDRRRVSIPFCIKTMKLALETLSGDSKSYAKSVLPSRHIKQDGKVLQSNVGILPRSTLGWLKTSTGQSNT